jgi:uncharacterized protein (TIGR02246 family)
MSEQEVLDLVQRWAGAELNGDVDAFDELLAADFAGVGPVGFVLDKEQWAGRHRGDLKNEEFEVKDTKVRLYGDAAVVVAVQAQKTKVMGHDSSGEFRVVVVATKQDGTWRIANVQLSGPLIAPGQMPPFAKPE